VNIDQYDTPNLLPGDASGLVASTSAVTADELITPALEEGTEEPFRLPDDFDFRLIGIAVAPTVRAIDSSIEPHSIPTNPTKKKKNKALPHRC
jgi:hypothetical protein